MPSLSETISSYKRFLPVQKLWLPESNVYPNVAAPFAGKLSEFYGNREVKHDVYGKQQMAKMKPLPSLFSCVYSRVKLFVFAMNSRDIVPFLCALFTDWKRRTQNQKLSLPFAICH